MYLVEVVTQENERRNKCDNIGIILFLYVSYSFANFPMFNYIKNVAS